MSAITFGRWGVDVSNERGATKVTRTGSRSWQFDLVVQGTTLENWRAHARQLAQLPECGVVPAAWVTEPWVDGFYEIEGVSYDLEPNLRHANAFEASIEARQVPWPRTPLIEMRTTGGDRSLTPGGVTPDPFVAIPSSHTALYLDTATASAYDRTGAGGTVRVITTGTDYSGNHLYHVAPADFYDMSPSATVDGVAVVSFADTDDYTAWSLDNGLIKAEPGTGTALLSCTIPNSGLTGWGTPFAVNVGYYDGSGFVLMDPDEVVGVQAWADGGQWAGVKILAVLEGGLCTVDLVMRRGSVLCDVTVEGKRSLRYGLSAPSGTWGTGASAQIYTAQDGHSKLLMSEGTAAAVDRRVYATTATTSARLAVGYSQAAGSAVSPNTLTEIRNQFFAAQTINERIIGAQM